MTQEEALKKLKNGENIFLTGPAGSGKTHTLNIFIDFLKKSKIGVGITASTGIAATHMNGRTIHSWCGIGIKDQLSRKDIDKLVSRDYLRDQFEKTSVLIIDEVSMLHSFRLNMVDQVCRAFKNPFLAFGGMQVVLSGDFFQLPPVSRYTDHSDFVFNSYAWQEMKPSICYLEEQFRQDDDEFLSLLNSIRSGTIDEAGKKKIQSRIGAWSNGRATPPRLFTHRADVDEINTKELEALPGEAFEYVMLESGEPSLSEELSRHCLAPKILTLKEGAQVMFVKNKYVNDQPIYINGTLGTIVGFDEENGNMPIVELDSGEMITVFPDDWSIDEDEKILAKISQIPLCLAWAITVHKSQGMSLDAAEIDLRKCFSFGMGYVALSRVRSLAGICLQGINAMAFKVDPKILEFDWELKMLSSRKLRK